MRAAPWAALLAAPWAAPRAALLAAPWAAPRAGKSQDAVELEGKKAERKHEPSVEGLGLRMELRLLVKGPSSLLRLMSVSSNFCSADELRSSYC